MYWMAAAVDGLYHCSTLPATKKTERQLAGITSEWQGGTVGSSKPVQTAIKFSQILN